MTILSATIDIWFEKLGIALEDVQKSLKLGAGYHTFRITLNQAQTYFFTASTSAGISSIKMVNLKKGGSDRIEYTGWKHDNTASTLKKSTCQAFALGDKMQYAAYANVYGEKVVRTVTQCQKPTWLIKL